MDKLRKDLMNDEGVKLKPYRCTSGKLTIGVGRNLDDAGITRQEALALLENDIAIVIRELNANVPWWGNLPEPASRGLANMCFNLGWPRLSEFRKMLGALEAGEFEEAADEALNSKWARQVGPRANRIAKLYRECVS